MKNQEWFEMVDIRRRVMNNAAWIPLRVSDKLLPVGDYGHLGFLSEFYGVGTLAIPLSCVGEASSLGWMDVGIGHSHAPFNSDNEYIAADIYQAYQGGWSGIHLFSIKQYQMRHRNGTFIKTLSLRLG